LLLAEEADSEVNVSEIKKTLRTTCPYYQECLLRSEICLTKTPELKELKNQLVACHHVLEKSTQQPYQDRYAGKTGVTSDQLVA